MTKKVNLMIATVVGLLALAGYYSDAAHFYQPRTIATSEHAEMQSWNELESITHKIDVLKLKIARITDRAAQQQRPLSAGEVQEITSLRDEIRLHHNRRNSILSGNN